LNEVYIFGRWKCIIEGDECCVFQKEGDGYRLALVAIRKKDALGYEIVMKDRIPLGIIRRAMQLFTRKKIWGGG